MQLEDYLEFEKTADYEIIRVKGTRIDIEIIVHEFHGGESPEEIQENYPSLTLEQVYGTISYYLHNKTEVDAYIQRSEAEADARYQEYLKQEPPPVVKRLRALKAQKDNSDLAAGKGKSAS